LSQAGTCVHGAGPGGKQGWALASSSPASLSIVALAIGQVPATFVSKRTKLTLRARGFNLSSPGS